MLDKMKNTSDFYIDEKDKKDFELKLKINTCLAKIPLSSECKNYEISVLDKNSKVLNNLMNFIPKHEQYLECKNYGNDDELFMVTADKVIEVPKEEYIEIFSSNEEDMIKTKYTRGSSVRECLQKNKINIKDVEQFVLFDHKYANIYIKEKPMTWQTKRHQTQIEKRNDVDFKVDNLFELIDISFDMDVLKNKIPKELENLKLDIKDFSKEVYTRYIEKTIERCLKKIDKKIEFLHLPPWDPKRTENIHPKEVEKTLQNYKIPTKMIKFSGHCRGVLQNRLPVSCGSYEASDGEELEYYHMGNIEKGTEVEYQGEKWIYVNDEFHGGGPGWASEYYFLLTKIPKEWDKSIMTIFESEKKKIKDSDNEDLAMFLKSEFKS